MSQPGYSPSLPSIPDWPQPSWLEEFLNAHPQQRERIEELQRRGREERDFAELVVREIYAHYATSSPSRWGLTVTLRAYAQLLDDVDLPRGQAADEDG